MSGAPGQLPRLLASAGPGRAATLAEHLAGDGLARPAQVDPAALRDEVERAGLRGRGGAAFPTARKLDAVARGRRAVLVANGAEGEPASGKDALLLARAPQLVLDGVALAAAAVGAREAIVCVRERSTAARAALAAALAERAGSGRDAVPVRIEPIPDGYVRGEETALVRHVDGGPGLPTSTPPLPFARGVGGRPTLVQNVETLAHVALIARHGAAWFRTLGTATSPGSALVTVSGAVARPGVREIALGTPLRTLLEQAGADTGALRAVLVGGYFGTWLPASVALDATLDDAALRPLGAALGCGVVAALPLDGCGVAETARLARWLAGQSAGQCGPCVHGLAAIAGQLEALADARAAPDALPRLRRWTGREVAGRGACRHPDGAVRLVRSALTVFAAELDDHARRGPCPACRRTPLLPLPHSAEAPRIEAAA
jgi:NADH:ubiquinone oxidoreductase subunit F (NADH-binding)